ncbi:LPS assembly protein LptD [Lysobacter sp. D1-1-M9]|uniref:LPS assembly protein LptD n=2 Tax=Novilysobacter TaxID=3382699 RepID=UPI0039832F2C
MRKPLRLLPLTLCISLALPVHAQDEDADDWGLCPIGDVVPAFDDAPVPQGTAQQRAQEPTDIEGGQLSRSGEGENLVVQDNVRLSRGDQFLGTDKLTYDEETGQYVAEGSVRYQDAGMRIVAERAQGNQTADRHRIENLQYQLVERRGNGGAERIQLEGAQGALIGSTYSTCDPDQRAWQLRARRIDIDTEEGMGVAHGAVVQIGRVPVLYVPWLMFPIDDRRRTGLLYPSISLSSRNGFDWKQPIYLNLAPNYDATLTPRLMTDRGTQLGGEFRWLYPDGRGTVSGEWMPSDELPEREPERYLRVAGDTLPDQRGLFRLNASHDLSRRWRVRANLGWVSDPHYLEDFSNSLYAVSTYTIRSTAGIFGGGRHWNTGLMAYHYQLADYTLTERNLQYDRLPRAYFNWSQPVGRWFEAGLNAEAVRFQHSVREEGSRLDVKPYIAMPLEGASWFVNPRLAWRYTTYQLDDSLAARTGDGSPTRTLPITSVDAGMFFDRPARLFGESYLHTLEPRIYYLNVPYRDQSGIPRFDTRPMTFSWGQLFRDNRYTGPDRQIDANQLTTALTTRLISEDDGRERLSASVGQIHYFEDSRVSAGETNAVQRGQSAWVADIGVSPGDRWTINAAYQWDPNFRREDLASIRARYLVGDSGVVNLGYRYRRGLVEQADFSFLYPIDRNWSLVGRYYYSIEEDKLLESIAGVQWESCCVAVRLVARRYVRDRDGDLDDSLRLEIELKGLGSAGQKTEGVLRRAILGYDRDDLYLVPPSFVPPGEVDPSPDSIL